jgi:hypothetical protein
VSGLNGGENMPFDMVFKVKAPANPKNVASVRSGAIASFGRCPRSFRFTLESRHPAGGVACLKGAIIGLVQRSKHDPLRDHLVGAGAKAPPRVTSAK